MEPIVIAEVTKKRTAFTDVFCFQYHQAMVAGCTIGVAFGILIGMGYDAVVKCGVTLQLARSPHEVGAVRAAERSTTMSRGAGRRGTVTQFMQRKQTGAVRPEWTDVAALSRVCSVLSDKLTDFLPPTRVFCRLL